MDKGYTMKRNLFLTALLVLLTACAHGKTQQFPNVENPADAARVVVIRDNNLMGWGFSLKVALDDKIIAGLRSGEHVAFYVKPGFHSLGVSKPTMTVPFEKAKTYYFLISADYTKFGFDIERIGDQAGNRWVAKTKALP